MASYSGRLDPLTLSDTAAFSGQSCVWRVRYGNFGSVAFAQLRLYTGACANYSVRVYGQSGSTVTLFAADAGATGGTDDCGSYFEVSSTSTANQIGVGARVRAANGALAYVAYDGELGNVAGGC